MTKEELEDRNEQLDVRMRIYLETHELPQHLVDSIGRKYLNIAYIRKRIMQIWPEVFKEIKSNLVLHNYE